MTRLCVPLTATTCQAMARQIDAAADAGAEMVELRLDYLQDRSADGLGEVLAKAKRFAGEVIATCRLAEEGGRYDEDEGPRIALMEQAARAGVDYLDLEYEAWRRSGPLRERIGGLCRCGGTSGPKLILSRHDFERTPADPAAMLDEIALEPADVAKLACRAGTITDALRVLDGLRASAAKRPTIALAMGETGVLTRVLAKKLGALLTFASLAAGKESAPGQVTIGEMRSLYRWDRIGAATPVYGVIGCPVAHSMSPAIHNAAFDAIGHDAIYLPMRVEPDYEAFEAFIDGCIERPWLGLRGCSVTIPHKKNLLDYVARRGGEIEPLAERIGVANTLCAACRLPGRPPADSHRRDAGATGRVDTGETPVTPRLSAFNTDYRGALDALCAGMGISGEQLRELSVAVLGAGGVARAIVAGLRDGGAAVTIYNRTQAKAEVLAAEFGATARPVDDRVSTRADAVVNCTSIGMWPEVDGTPLPAEALAHRPAVFDTVYNPVETRLLREAREHGCVTIDGATMFVNQAVAQFERWTGCRAPIGVMRDVVLAQLGQ